MIAVRTPEEMLGVESLPTVLTAQQAATLLGVSKQTVYRAFEDGELRGLKVRGRVSITTQPLIEALGLTDGDGGSSRDL